MFVFVIHRDRPSYADRCVAALLETPGLDVVIVDHASTSPAARNWLAEMRHAGIVVSEWDNQHPRDLWTPAGIISHMMAASGTERFIVTDCDVVPDPDCPGIWLDLLHGLLDANPAAVKAGMGLRTDNLPERYAKRSEVQGWEANYQPPVARPVEGGLPAVWADIDTTLAMYRRFEPFKLGPAIRTTAPYLARHLPWHEDTANPTGEQAFYAAHAEHGHWRAPDSFHDEHGLDQT